MESYRATKLSESAKGGIEIMLLPKRLTDRFGRFRKSGEEIGPMNVVKNNQQQESKEPSSARLCQIEVTSRIFAVIKSDLLVKKAS